MAASCSAMGKTALPCHYLAPPTWSVPYFVGTDLRTERLAIACDKRSGRQSMQSPQRQGPAPIASRNQSAIHVSVKGDERAWKDETEVTR